MVRTKGDRIVAKAVGGKASHKVSNATGGVKKSGNNSKVIRSYSGGNPYHPRETPDWQKPITNFMNQSVTKDNNVTSSSKDNEDKENQNTSIVSNN